MFINLKWKIPLILFVMLGAVYLSYPLKDKIALGLDLQGGMHLVLEVQTEKAVEASLERIADDIKREIEKEDYEIDRVSADYENKTVTVLMVDAIDLEAVEEIMESFTAYLKI
jgi:preprotein translocase subunit SecD